MEIHSQSNSGVPAGSRGNCTCATVELVVPRSMPSTHFGGEPHDPRWCCTESALVATLAFSILGVRCKLIDGMAALVDREVKSVCTVSPHWFVALFTGDMVTGVFDASATVGHIRGIAADVSCPGRELSLVLPDRLPPQQEAERFARLGGTRFTAMHAPKRSVAPTKVPLPYTSSTPFGRWLSAFLGSQVGIWTKAAVVLSQVLCAGAPDSAPAAFFELDKVELWHWVAETPDADEFVKRRLAGLGLPQP
jgi:hypothetical protein